MQSIPDHGSNEKGGSPTRFKRLTTIAMNQLKNQKMKDAPSNAQCKRKHVKAKKRGS